MEKKARFSITMPKHIQKRLDRMVSEHNESIDSRSELVSKFVEHGLNDYPSPRSVVCIDVETWDLDHVLRKVSEIRGVKSVHTIDRESL